MKIVIKYLVALIIISSVLTSCKKYEDGPTFSLASAELRLTNEWQVESVNTNGIDLTALLSSYTITFTESKKYIKELGLLTVEGTWSFNDDKSKVILTLVGSTETLTILKLKSNEFWTLSEDGLTETHYIKK